MANRVPSAQTGLLTDNQHGTDDVWTVSDIYYGDAYSMFDDSHCGNNTQIRDATATAFNFLAGKAFEITNNSVGDTNTLITIPTLPLVSYTQLQNSTYLDLTSYRGNGTLPSDGHLSSAFSFNVALVLERANDPTALLNSDWASRQQQLETLNQNGTLWSTYGADPTKYNQALKDLQDLGISTFYVKDAPPNQQYVSSPESRTIWLNVDQANFTKLFGANAALLDGQDSSGNPITFWRGNLSLPNTLIADGVTGLWFDNGALSNPILADPGGGNASALAQGPQSPGNSVPGGQFPNVVAADYNFPFSSNAPFLSTTVPTGRIGLLEPGIGNALLLGEQPFDDLLNAYRKSAGINTSAQPTIDVAPGGQNFANADERSLDVGVATTASPESQLVLYAWSGYFNNAHADAFTAYQAAFWDTLNNPEVVSSSFKSFPRVAPGSPFYTAQHELFVDAALRNISAINAAGDGGSGDEYPNGLTNVAVTHASPYSLIAGGASLSTISSAANDPTLSSIFAEAMAGNLATIWQLMAGGLTFLPSTADPADKLIETAWNAYYVSGSDINGGANPSNPNGQAGGYLANFAGSGGVDPSQPRPQYQTDFGLHLVTSDPSALQGRGIPDVSATSGGNTGYTVPQPDMTGTQHTGGTSGAAPLWAALLSQFDAIFHDQGLPQLGYMNDLLYTAAVIAPASFNDVTLGNNTSSLTLGGSFSTDGVDVTPTGYGYSAGPGYDLTTGLGTPNGTLLGRALTAIAHEQMFFATTPDVVDSHESGGLTTPVAETLLIQTIADAATTVSVLTGSDGLSFTSAPSASFASTSLLAQQLLQPDFDPNLVRMFDGQTQGELAQSISAAGHQLDVLINGAQAQTPQVNLSDSFGFVDFVSASGDSMVRVARPIAVAETAGGLDDQQAVVRIRQNGADDLILKLYRVDDFNGTINGLHPGDPGYQAAADGRAYQLTTGGTSINGPGYGNYEQTELQHVNAGDLVAMQLTNSTTGNTYWAFSQANEVVDGQPVGHLWNYGLNTWGWEDTPGGGDRDYNDLIIGIDFTSASGHGWLV